MWQPLASYRGNLTTATTGALELGTAYDFRVRAVTYLGGESVWQPIFNYVIGSSTGGVTEFIDLGFVDDTVSDIWDLGLVSQPVTETKDLGAIGTLGE